MAVVDDPSRIASTSALIASVLDVSDPQTVTIETSQQVAQLRVLIDEQLGDSSRALVAGIFAITGVLVAAILYALVTLRRRDFGRRRAPGASRAFIVGLVVVQAAILAAFGAVLGSAIATIVLGVDEVPQPRFTYYIAISMLAIAIASVSAFIPAVVAARRDPARELRVP